MPKEGTQSALRDSLTDSAGGERSTEILCEFPKCDPLGWALHNDALRASLQEFSCPLRMGSNDDEARSVSENPVNCIEVTSIGCSMDTLWDSLPASRMFSLHCWEMCLNLNDFFRASRRAPFSLQEFGAKGQ